MLAFCFAPGSSSMAAHIGLHEVGAPFEPHPISFAKREQRAPEYLALNPEGKVPTLVIDGRPLTEVAAILYYLARRFPDAGLLPKDDPEAEAQAISWISFIAATLHPARRRGLDYAKIVYGFADRLLGQDKWALGTPAPIPRLPEIGIMMRKSATADLRAGRLEGWKLAIHQHGSRRRA